MLDAVFIHYACRAMVKKAFFYPTVQKKKGWAHNTSKEEQDAGC